jgi:pyruvate ferredoxin oxidoreductase delta subunit
MKRTLQIYDRPQRIEDFPVGPHFRSGHLVEISAGMRTFRPMIDSTKCRKCMVCFLICPDGAICRGAGGVTVDYDFCKGCGLCAHECKFGAISMRKEGE